MNWYLGGCAVCSGDMVREYDELRCLQGGHRFYPNRPAEWTSEVRGAQLFGHPGRYTWDERNKDIIAAIRSGMTTEEVATAFSKAPRYIRQIRERIKEDY